MSVVKITDHNENIYALSEEKEEQRVKPSRYSSIYQDKIRDEIKSRQRANRTFGHAVEPLHPPRDYLKKYSLHNIPHDPPAADHNHFAVRCKAPLPRRNKSGRIIHREVDHCVENVRKMSSAVPRKPQPKCVDTKSGDLFDVNKSGLVPKYMLEGTFGKVPEYIQRRKSVAQQRAKARFQAVDEQYQQQRFISDKERNEILTGLRRNYEELQKEYKALPLLTDTIPKKTHKTKLENQLKDLEKDMMFLEINPYIVIA